MKTEDTLVEDLATKWSHAELDGLTGNALTASTSADRLQRIAAWLAQEPSFELLTAVFKDLSQRDKGVAKLVKDKLDEVRRGRHQEDLAKEWSAKAQHILSATKFNMANAMAWQRDAAKAGAPLSLPELSQLKSTLADRVKAIEDLMHQIQVEREASVLLAQRIEVLSTRPLQDAEHARATLAQDVQRWETHSQQLLAHPEWSALEPRFANMLNTSLAQLNVVWQAFGAALDQALAAQADAQHPLPSVPVWADEIRLTRAQASGDQDAVLTDEERLAAQTQAVAQVTQLADELQQAIDQGQARTVHKLVASAKIAVKEQSRWLDMALQARVQRLLGQAGDLEGWQRWSGQQVRDELVRQAQALAESAKQPNAAGRKIQENLRNLRDQWKRADKAGPANPAIWRKFDEACNAAHQVVDAWLQQAKAQSAVQWAERQQLLAQLNDWTAQHAQNTDWKTQARELHRFAENWRNGGHLSDKQFADIQPKWKEAMAAARAPLDAAQSQAQARRQLLIERAQQLVTQSQWSMDAVKSLQHEWQHEAQQVSLDRRLEQKLWDQFKLALDEAFANKQQQRTQQAAALSAHDQQVVDAAKQLHAACAEQDAQRIQAAMQALHAAIQATQAASASTPADAAAPANEPAAADKPAQAAKKLVAVRGDDRPGQNKPPLAQPAQGGKGAKPTGGKPAAAHAKPFDRFDAARAPRLGDAAFRAQRDALDAAQHALKQLATQAHGQSAVQLLQSWQDRGADAIAKLAEPQIKLPAAARNAWTQALSSNVATDVAAALRALLRLEMAAEVPTPAEFLNDRRALQLQLLTRRNDPSPAQTWVTDVAAILACAFDQAYADRLQAVLRVLLRRG